MSLRYRTQSRRGMTLVELMLAVLLASFVMLAVVRFVDVSLGLWSRSEDTRRETGRGQAVLQRLRSDLVSVHSGQVGDFLLEWQGFDMDGDRASDRAFPRLRLVRRPSALDWRRLSLRDMTPDQRAVFAELGFGEGSALAVRKELGELDASLEGLGLATAPGLVESAWVLLPDGEGESGTGTLYRGERKRGAKGERASFFHRNFVGSGGSVEDPLLERITGGVLWWSVELGDDSTADEWTVGVAPGQARMAWDALGQGRPDVQSAAVNETAVDRPLEEGRPLMPSKARLIIELETERSRTRAPFLLQGLDREVNSFDVSRGETLPLKPGSYLRIGKEWMRMVSRKGDRVVVERGQRGTLAGLHDADTKVRYGRRTEARVTLPTSRQEWR